MFPPVNGEKNGQKPKSPLWDQDRTRALDWNRCLRIFIEPDFNKEPTLSQTRTKLESAFMTDNRLVLEWEADREKPHDFLGRREP